MKARRVALSLVWCFVIAATSISAATPSAPPAGPPFPQPTEGQAVNDFAGVLDKPRALAPSSAGPIPVWLVYATIQRVRPSEVPIGLEHVAALRPNRSAVPA